MTEHSGSAWREDRRLKQLQRELQTQGYTVQLRPIDQDLPTFLRGLAPDLLASRGDEHVVIEVKTKESVRGDPRLERLAEALEGREGWAFQLVLTNPRERAPDFGDPVSRSHVDHLLALANETRRLGSFPAAFALLWTAFEGVLRHVLPPESQSGSPLALLKTAYSLGFIDSQQLADLESAVRVRNRVVHGIAVTPDWHEFDRVLSATQSLAVSVWPTSEHQLDEINTVLSRYDEAYVERGMRSGPDLRRFAEGFYRDVAEIFDSLTRFRNMERNPSGFSLDDAPILGLLVRMWKLLKEIVRYYEASNAEMIGLLDRAFLEAAVTVEYLMKRGPGAIEDYRKCSYKHRLRLLTEYRAGSPFFETKAGQRLIRSIQDKLQAEGLNEDDFDVQRKNRWRIGGVNFYDIFDEIHGGDLYPMTYGIMSESIHGSWNDSMDYSLVRNDDGTYLPYPFHQPADPRFVGPLLRFAVPAYRAWLQRIEVYDESIGEVLDWIERVNGRVFLKFDDFFDGP